MPGMQTSGAVGPQPAGDNANPLFRQDRSGAQIATPGLPPYRELARLGRIFTIVSPVAGVALGTAFGTTAPISLFNPVGNTMRAVILKAWWAYKSGTMGLCSLAWGKADATTLPTGTAIVPACGLVGNSGNGSMKGFSGANAAVATPSMLRPTGISFGAFLGGAGNPMPALIDEVNGDIELISGGLVVLQGIGAAGTSDLSFLGIEYAEIPNTES